MINGELVVLVFKLDSCPNNNSLPTAGVLFPFGLLVFKEYTILQHFSIYRSVWHVSTLPLLQLTLWHSCQKPFGIWLKNSHNIKANCLFF